MKLPWHIWTLGAALLVAASQVILRDQGHLLLILAAIFVWMWLVIRREFAGFLILLASVPVWLLYCVYRGSGAFALPYMSDQLYAGHMFRLLLARHMGETGTFLQWNPHQFAGMPYIEGFHGALFYPPTFLNSGTPSLVAVSWVLIVAFIGWLVWRYATKGMFWPRYWIICSVVAYPIHAHLIPLLTPVRGNTWVSILDLWGWVAGFGLAYCFWRWARNEVDWYNMASIFFMTAVVAYFTFTLFDVQGYAYDWMAEYAVAAPAREAIMVLGDGKSWGVWHWVTRPLCLAAGWCLVFSTRYWEGQRVQLVT